MYSKEEEKKFTAQSKTYLTTEIKASDYNDLIACLHFHEWRYYVKNDALISDYDFDQLINKLKSIEDSGQIEIRKDSPSQRVSSDLSSDFPSVAHLVPMLSLGNSYSSEDLQDFDEQIKRLLLIEAEKDLEYFVEPKFDGGSVSIIYENDLLIRAATRGNGVEGNEITNNIRSLSSVPLRAEFSKYGLQKVELRGEAIIRKDNFDKMNLVREEQGLTLFANPRNTAAGGLRTKNPKETRDRQIEVFIFQIGYAEMKEGKNGLLEIESQKNAISLLSSLGFKVPLEIASLCNNINEAHQFVESWETRRDDYSYEIDGMVIKLNDFELQDKAGFTQHHPRWAMAYKFGAKQAVTRLNAVEYQIGRTGAITPVAKVEPVPLAGVTISSISLHNEDFILQKDLRIGDHVLIERAGDVIPYVVKSLAEKRKGSEEPIKFPERCPDCNTDLVKEENEAAWRCPNNLCESQQIQRIIFHVSKDAMDIDGFGKSYVEKFYDLGWLKDISDVYNLDYRAIAELEGFGQKSASKLEASINKAKENSVQKVLHGLGIHHLGKKASKLIAEKLNSVFDLTSWQEDQYTEIKDIGPKVAKNVAAFFQVEENLEMLKRMETYGVNMLQKEEDKPIQFSLDAPFAGKTILFTGTFQQMGRKVAQEMAERNGAKNISAVSKNLDVLVVGEKAGSKLKKALALGTVEILTEQEFLDRVS